MTSPPQIDPKAYEEKLRTLQRVMTTKYPIAQTPKEVVWSLNKAKLYRYIPVVPAAERHPVPLVLVFALINRPSILDLRPGGSFVEYMVRQGYDVYMVDWGVPGPEDKNLKFDDYVLDYMPRIFRKVKSLSGSNEFSLLGWCMGAILSTLYAALRPDDGLRNLILLTAPLDFSDKSCGGFMKWVSDKNFDVEKIAQSFDVIPGDLIDYGAKALKPVENYISSYLRLWDNIDDPRVVDSWHAMNTWVTDLIPFSSASFRQLINEFYRGNRLMDGTLTIRGEAVDLERFQANLLNVVADNDHIVPPPESITINDKVGSSDTELVRVKGGHIGVMAGSGAVKHTWPRIESWLAPRSAATPKRTSA